MENIKDKIIYLAETNFRNQKRKFGIKKDDRRRHMYLIGKTGMGKSTVMENMIVQDIQNGEGVALIDPHGDFAEKILNYIPQSRINDVTYLNPADIEFPIAFNVMETVSQEHKHLVASGLVGVFKKLWVDSWGPRLEYVLRNAILGLLDYPGSTLLGVMRILVDKNFRKKVIAKMKDPVVKAFWIEEYSKYPDRFQAEAIAPIQNKVGQFLSTALIRNIVGQVKSTINIRDIMDNQKIIILNLAKGRIGEDASALLGAMMITKIQLAAMSRIDIAEDKRKDFYLYVDEFQNFATESFANILSEARKYRLDLIIAHQYIEQLDEKVGAAVFGNVGTMMCFRIGAADAEFLVKEFSPYFDEEDLVNLTKYDIYMKLMIDGVSSNPFSATTLLPLPKNESEEVSKKIIKVSRERYAKPKDIVEDKIARWSGMDIEEDIEGARQVTFTPPAVQKSTVRPTKDKVQKDRVIKTKERRNIVECYECGKPTEVSFIPDGIRPVYCKSCFQKMKGRVKFEKTVEPGTAVPEISLQEALTQKPISFTQHRKATTMPISEKNIETNAPDITTIKQETNKNTTQPQKTNIKLLEPGKIVKF